MVAGSVSRVGIIYSVSSRMVNVETGEIIKTATYDHEGNIGELLKTGMRVVASKLAGVETGDRQPQSNVIPLPYNPESEINPSDAEAFFNRGIAYADIGEYDRAISDYDRALTINSKDANAFYHKAVSCELTGRVGEAIQAYGQFIKLARPGNLHLEGVRKRIRELSGK